MINHVNYDKYLNESGLTYRFLFSFEIPANYYTKDSFKSFIG